MAEKLVRDMIPEIARQDGKPLEYWQAGRHRIQQLLQAKMVEEMAELALARSREHQVEELADIAEVVLGLCRWHGIEPADVEMRRSAKAAKEGGFSHGLVARFPDNPQGLITDWELQRVHHLKTWPYPFRMIGFGEKTYELRREDRDFQVGDHLVLREFVGHAGGNPYYTGAWQAARITYLSDKTFPGIAPGYVVLAISTKTRKGVPLPFGHKGDPMPAETLPASEGGQAS